MNQPMLFIIYTCIYVYKNVCDVFGLLRIIRDTCNLDVVGIGIVSNLKLSLEVKTSFGTISGDHIKLFFPWDMKIQEIFI